MEKYQLTLSLSGYRNSGVKMSEVEIVSEVVGRKRKGGETKTERNKKKKKEVILVPDETQNAVQDLLKELNDSIQLEEYSPLEPPPLQEEKRELTLKERFHQKVESVELFDSIEDFEKTLKGDKMKALKSRMIYKKPEWEDSELEYDDVSPPSTRPNPPEDSHLEYGNVSPVPGVYAKLNSNLKPEKTKEDDGLATMVRLSSIFQSPGFLQNKPSRKPRPSLDHMVCLFHDVRLEVRVSKAGWHYVKCPRQPCLLFCPEEEADVYMKHVHTSVHPSICDKWETLVCYCRNPVTLRQSKSEKNPGRLYIGCSGNGSKCKFFHWSDLPLTAKYLKWFYEEKDLPQVTGNNWGNQFTEEELRLLRSIREKNSGNITTTNTVELPPPAPAPPFHCLSNSERKWLQSLADSTRDNITTTNTVESPPPAPAPPHFSDSEKKWLESFATARSGRFGRPSGLF